MTATAMQVKQTTINTDLSVFTCWFYCFINRMCSSNKWRWWRW